MVWLAGACLLCYVGRWMLRYLDGEFVKEPNREG